ncbi:MAG TPA: MMPL family transporter [Vicinamibacterales bacterium]|jgi:hypothetical protein
MIERLLRFAFTRRGTVLAAAAAVFLLSVALLSRLSFDANILNLLPQKGLAVRSFNTYLEHFGTLDHIYVLFEVPDGRISDQEDLIDAYVERLRRAPEIASVDAELFDSVKDWNYLFDRELLLLGKDQSAAALARLAPAGMTGELERSRGMLAMSSPEVKAYVQQDPLGLLRLLRDRLSRGEALVSFDPTQKGYVSRDGRSRLVIAKPVRPPFDTDFCKRLFARLGEVEAAARRDVDRTANLRIQIAGGYRIALEAERVIRVESIVNSLTSLAGLLALVFIVFRTPWILLYATVPLVIAAVFTLGVNGLAGKLTPATSGASAMLFGLGIDGIALLYLRYMEERGRGYSEVEAVARCSGTASSILLAYATTGTTFLALMLVDFPSLEELGRLVGLGIIACCLLLLTLVPALVGFTRPEVHRRPVTSAWLGVFVERFGRPILWTAAVLTLVLGIAATSLRLDTRLEKLQANTEGAALEQQMATRFSLPRDVLLAVGEGRDLEPLLQDTRRIAGAVEHELPSVAFSSPDTLLPPATAQGEVALLVRQSGLQPAAVVAELSRAAKAAGFRPGTFDGFAGRLPRMLDSTERITYEGLQQHGLSSLVSRYVARTETGYLVVVYLYPRAAADVERVSRLVNRAAPSFRLTGVPQVNRELAQRFLPQFLKGVIVGTLGVALLIYFVFRSVRDTLLAFLPTALGFVWSAGLLALLRVELDLFSLFAAMTFIGIATDYGIYVIYRHSVEHTWQVREVLTRTGAGILVACGTTLIGFGSLVNSSYAPLHSFGITSVTTIASCLVAAVLVLPALLQERRRP